MARSSISATIGGDDRAYAVHRDGIDWHAENSRHGLAVDFGASGVTLQTGASHWKMRLLAYGYGNEPHAVAGLGPQGRLNRVEYHRGAMTEWYANGPAGLEQGFTLNRAPGKSNGKPLTIALELSGDQRATVERDQRGLGLGSGENENLRYRGLSAYDANGKELRAWLELRGEQLRLRVEDAEARYPVVIDPWVQVAELTASDGKVLDHFGGEVAISGDTIAVGAPAAQVGSNSQQGAVYVFVKPATGWKDMTETAKVTASDGGTLDTFGGAIAINDSTIVIGARGHNSFQGVAYVFVKPKNGWRTTSKFTAKLSASDGKANDYFGDNLAMDGNTVVVTELGGVGYVYVYVKPLAGWKTATQSAKLRTREGAALGTVAMSGNTVVAGGGFNSNRSAAYVYAEPASGWRDMTETARLNASDEQKNDDFGIVGISGSTIVVGSPYATVNQDFDRGAAYVFVKPAGGWTSTTETAKLTASDGTSYDTLGRSVAIRGDAIAVGAPNALAAKRYSGAVYLFVKPRGGWKTTSTFQAKLKTFDVKGNIAFAIALALGDGVVVVGAPDDHPQGQQYGPGSAFVFTQH